MKRAILVLLVAAMCSARALAEVSLVHVFPFGPTTATPVEVHVLVPCPYVVAVVEHLGLFLTVVNLLPDDRCAVLLPTPSVLKVPITRLLPAVERHRIEVRFADGSLYGETEFMVRSARPSPVQVHPFAVPAVGGLPLRLTGVSCDTPDCSDIAIFVGFRMVPFERRSDGSIWLEAPPAEPGPSHVSVAWLGRDHLDGASIYYFESPAVSLFERILFPLLDSAEGAYGSKWVTEATISNPRPWFVENASSVQDNDCITRRCRARLMPGSTFNFEGRGYPRGAILFAPRTDAADLAFGLRARDVSRQAEGLGTRIPVVREKDMVHGESIELLDVPIDPQYRVKARIYAVGPFFVDELRGSVSILRATGAETIAFTMTPAEGNVPAYAEIELPAGAANERVHLIIEPPLDATAWAFATITHNETQQFTIVTP